MVKELQRAGAPAENKMGVMPVNRLLVSMSVPMMLSMLVQALYNIVDSIFVARISEDALTAVSLAFPVQTLMVALTVGTGVGLNALLSRSLGEKNEKRVRAAVGNGVFLALVMYLLLLGIGLFGTELFYASQTSDPEILQHGKDYLSVICCCSFGFCVQVIFERLLQSTGKTVYAMAAQATGAIFNIIFDPIFIFGLGPIPAMGVKGAAIATVLGQIAAGVLAVILNQLKNPEVRFSFKSFRPSLSTIGRIYAVGAPSIVMQSIGSFMTYGMNLILMGFSSTAAAVFGVYFKLQSFIFMPIFGLNNGMVPIIAYNYGAKKRARLVETARLAVVYATCIMLLGLLLFQLLPDKMLLLFNASPDMLKIGVPALRIISLHFILAGFDIVGGSLFQALGNAVYSMIVSICRQLVVLLPVAYLLSLTGNVSAVWWALPIAELMAVTMTVIFLWRIYQKVIKKIPPCQAV